MAMPRLEVQPSGDVAFDVQVFLLRHSCQHTLEHSRVVASQAVCLAARFGVDRRQAEDAAWLHDVSACIPVSMRLRAARDWGIEVLPEEATAPMILHQKLSEEMARTLFKVTSQPVLSAVGCHTTLRRGAGDLDRVLFLADKMAWDQPGRPPYLDEVKKILTTEGARADVLSRCVAVYLRYLWAQRATLRVVHPWLADACAELCGRASKGA